MINHLSRQSAEFQDFQRRGRQSPNADLFITLDKVWPDGDPPAADIAKIVLRKPDSPFSTITIERNRRNRARLDIVRNRRLVRTDRPRRDRAGDPRADLRVAARPRLPPRAHRSPRRRRLRHQEARDELLHGRAGDLRVPRVDHRRRRHAPADPPPGSARPLLDTPTAFSSRLLDLRLRPAGHGSRRPLHRPGRSARRPPRRSPAKQFTTLDCHDGIPVRPDLDGLLEPRRSAPSPSAPSPVAET